MAYPHQNANTACVLSFITQKGGMGKTTLTQLASLHLYYHGSRVLVIDADNPQHSFAVLRAQDLEALQSNESLRAKFNEGGLPVLPLKTGVLADLQGHLHTLKHSGQYDYIFVDVPGTLAVKGLNELIKELDIVLLPMEMDMKSFVSGLQTLDYILPINPQVKLFAYWNRIKKAESEAMILDVNEAISKKHTITVLKKRLNDLVSIKRDTSTVFPPTQKDVLEFMDELADHRIGSVRIVA